MNDIKERHSAYYDRIREIVAAAGAIGTDPRHVEAWMRLEHSTLDGLSVDGFRREVIIALECIKCSPFAENEALAVSYGL